MDTIVKVWCGEGREDEISRRITEAGLPVVLISTGRVYARVGANACGSGTPSGARAALLAAPRALLDALRRRHGTAFGLDAKPRLCAAVPEASPFYWNLPPDPQGADDAAERQAEARPRSHGRRTKRRKAPC